MIVSGHIRENSSIFCLYSQHHLKGIPILSHDHPSNDFNSIAPTINELLIQVGESKPVGVILAVNEKAGWGHLAAVELASSLKIDQVRIITENEALGWAGENLSNDGVILLNPASDLNKGGHRLIISVSRRSVHGCLLLRSHYGSKVMEIDAGRIPVPCRGSRDYALQKFFQTKLNFSAPRPVELAELCAPELALPLLYEFVRAEIGQSSSKTNENQPNSTDEIKNLSESIEHSLKIEQNSPFHPSPEDLISLLPDPIAYGTLELWFDQLRAGIYNLMTITLPAGGVVLVSDFLLSILKSSAKNDLLIEFMHKLILRDHLFFVFENSPIVALSQPEFALIKGTLNALSEN